MNALSSGLAPHMKIFTRRQAKPAEKIIPWLIPVLLPILGQIALEPRGMERGCVGTLPLPTIRNANAPGRALIHRLSSLRRNCPFHGKAWPSCIGAYR